MSINSTWVARLLQNIVATLGLCLVLICSSSVWAQTFGGSGLPLAVPDNDPAGVDSTVTVSGITSDLIDVSVSLTFNAPHSWVGDVIATISAPGGGPTANLFVRIGRMNNIGFGDSSSFAGPYLFVDPTTPGSQDIWFEASQVDFDADIPAGTYFTSSAGSDAGTPLNAFFTGLTPAQINGDWTINVSDSVGGDTGTVSAAELILVESVAPSATSPRTSQVVPTLPIYGLGLTVLGLLLMASRRLKAVGH